MPGGLDAVRNVTNQLKARGVRVLWPYNPWDTGTRREDPDDDPTTFARLLKETNGDGFNGDTMGFVPESFWQASEKVDYPLAFEPEGGGTDAALNWSTMGWGYFDYPHVPNVARFKFLTGGAFMTNVCDRWAKTKTDNLHTAWFNGIGYESWENVWGTWNGITPRDGEAIRRVGKMLRFFGGRDESYCWHYNETLDVLHDSKYEPHVVNVLRPDVVFASKFSSEDGVASLYTLVNRGHDDLVGEQQLWIVPNKTSRVFDCYHGVELTLETPNVTNTSVPDVPKGYVLFPNANAYDGHGATDIDVDPVANLSVKACAARCDNDASCQCATFESSTGNCWKRGKCVPEAFDVSSTSYAVYAKAKGYAPWSARNAYAGHGGIEIDTDATAPEGVSVDACQARCDADATCGCVTYKSSLGKCWKRSACEPTAFETNEAFDTYVRMSEQPSCVAQDGSCGSTPVPPPKDAKAVSFDMEGDGFGCVLHLTSAEVIPSAISTFLKDMQHETSGRPLSSFDSTWTYLPQTLVGSSDDTLGLNGIVGVVEDEDMVSIPANTSWSFVMTGVMIEGDDDHGVGVQYPWMSHPMKEVNQRISIDAFSIDRYPVTEADYSAYLNATGFQPTDTYNYLKNWNGSKTSHRSVPVTYVSLSEARRYCAWRGGARLPTAWEWQYAAQGQDGRLYPWGSEKIQANFPTMQDGNVIPGAEDVHTYAPHAASPFGLLDLVGNTYEYTDEFQDEHTRFVVLRGGSNYRPTGSSWYFPQALELNTYEKYFLMDDRYERCGTIGFRCARSEKNVSGSFIRK